MVPATATVKVIGHHLHRKLLEFPPEPRVALANTGNGRPGQGPANNAEKRPASPARQATGDQPGLEYDDLVELA